MVMDKMGSQSQEEALGKWKSHALNEESCGM